MLVSHYFNKAFPRFQRAGSGTRRGSGRRRTDRDGSAGSGKCHRFLDFPVSMPHE